MTDYQRLDSNSYGHPTQVHSVRACLYDDALDLLAVGGESHVEVLQRNMSSEVPTFDLIASFYVGTAVRAIAWSPRIKSPSMGSNWFLELVVAGADHNLRLLLRSPSETLGEEPETIVRPFGGGLSGHHKQINDVCFCTAKTYDTHVASIGDDGLILWNLYPSSGEDEEMTGVDGHDTDIEEDSPPRPRRSTRTRSISAPQVAAYMIRFSHPLHSIASHPLSANQFMVSDSHGTVYLIDWTQLETDKPAGWRGHKVVELVDPRALTDSLTGKGGWTGGASWNPKDISTIGATYGSRWSVWDLRNLQGGKPIRSGTGHEHGGDRFRWCPTDPQMFAISSASPEGGALIKVFRTTSPTSPREFKILQKPHRVRDFDWLAAADPEDTLRAWLAVAIGKRVFFVAGGDPMSI